MSHRDVTVGSRVLALVVCTDNGEINVALQFGEEIYGFTTKEARVVVESLGLAIAKAEEIKRARRTELLTVGAVDGLATYTKKGGES